MIVFAVALAVILAVSALVYFEPERRVGRAQWKSTKPYREKGKASK